MTVQQLAQTLAQFESTHEKPEILNACLDFCVDFFKGYPVIVKQYENNGIRSAIVQTQDTLHVDIMTINHLDTVPGHPHLFKGTIEDGKLFGRGTLDMKAFSATSMMVMKNLLDEGFTGNIALAFFTDEELGGVYGANYAVNTLGYTADVVLVPDDGEHINRIVVESKHIFHLTFTAHGKEAHAARPWMGTNAIDLLLNTYQELRKHFTHYLTPPEDIWVNTINLGKIVGGVATNEVPASATMNVDIRITSDTTRAEVIEWIENALVPGVDYTVSMEGYPTMVDNNDPIFQQYVDAVESVIGASPEYIKNGGGTDGRYFAQKGMRVIVHQGTGGYCQSDDEYVDLQSLDQLVSIHQNFIRAYYSFQ